MKRRTEEERRQIDLNGTAGAAADLGISQRTLLRWIASEIVIVERNESQTRKCGAVIIKKIWGYDSSGNWRVLWRAHRKGIRTPTPEQIKRMAEIEAILKKYCDT